MLCFDLMSARFTWPDVGVGALAINKTQRTPALWVVPPQRGGGGGERTHNKQIPHRNTCRVKNENEKARGEDRQGCGLGFEVGFRWQVALLLLWWPCLSNLHSTGSVISEGDLVTEKLGKLEAL